MQCVWLSVWSVKFNFDTLSCHNYFSRRYGGCTKNLKEIPEGWSGGGSFLGSKNGNSGEEGRLA